MHKNIMRNAGATPASALRMGELVPRGQRNNKDVYVLSPHHGAGMHNLRLVLIGNFLKFLSSECACCVFRDKNAVIQGVLAQNICF